MQNTIDQFLQYHSAISAKFNSLGALNPAQDACFFGISKGRIARHMLQLAQQTNETDAETLIGKLRVIYSQVESEIAGGLPFECRDELTNALVEGHHA